jgi:hypothetical protein
MSKMDGYRLDRPVSGRPGLSWAELGALAPTLALLATLAAAGCAGAARQPTAFQPVASVQEVMLAITVPMSNTVFAAAGEPPGEAQQWVAVERAALALAESGNLLLMPGRARDNGEWRTRSVAMIEAASLAARAAHDRNADRLMDASDAVYESCESCHQRYMPHP